MNLCCSHIQKWPFSGDEAQIQEKVLQNHKRNKDMKSEYLNMTNVQGKSNIAPPISKQGFVCVEVLWPSQPNGVMLQGYNENPE